MTSLVQELSRCPHGLRKVFVFWTWFVPPSCLSCPSCLKQVVLQPHIRTRTLTPLFWLGLLVVPEQLQSYLDLSSVSEKLRSGFKSRHSTETMLLKVLNDVFLAVDPGCSAVTCGPTCGHHGAGPQTFSSPLRREFVGPAGPGFFSQLLADLRGLRAPCWVSSFFQHLCFL